MSDPLTDKRGTPATFTVSVVADSIPDGPSPPASDIDRLCYRLERIELRLAGIDSSVGCLAMVLFLLAFIFALWGLSQ